jgi:hypothetical protein
VDDAVYVNQELKASTVGRYCAFDKPAWAANWWHPCRNFFTGWVIRTDRDDFALNNAARAASPSPAAPRL